MSRLLLALAACVGVCSAMEEESPILRGGGAPRLPKEVKDDIHHFKHQDCGGVQKNCDRSLKFPMCCAKPGGFSYCSASSPYAHPADGRDPFNPCAPGFTRDAAHDKFTTWPAKLYAGLKADKIVGGLSAGLWSPSVEGGTGVAGDACSIDGPKCKSRFECLVNSKCNRRLYWTIGAMLKEKGTGNDFFLTNAHNFPDRLLPMGGNGYVQQPSGHPQDGNARVSEGTASKIGKLAFKKHEEEMAKFDFAIVKLEDGIETECSVATPDGNKPVNGIAENPKGFGWMASRSDGWIKVKMYDEGFGLATGQVEEMSEVEAEKYELKCIGLETVQGWKTAFGAYSSVKTFGDGQPPTASTPGNSGSVVYVEQPDGSFKAACLFDGDATCCQKISSILNVVRDEAGLDLEVCKSATTEDESEDNLEDGSEDNY